LESAARQRGSEADAEGLHVNVAPLGDGEMAQLVEENDKTEAESGQDDVPQALAAEPVVERADAYGEHGQEEAVARHPNPPRQLRVVHRLRIRGGRRHAATALRGLA